MNGTALVCDDSLLMRKMVRDALEDQGWTVVAEACDGSQAFEAYKTHRPDVVTMDIVMPGFDGLWGLEHIIGFDPAARVVMVSALNQTKLISEAIRKGAQDFLAKPFLPEQLQETVATCRPSCVGA